jgi:hypothetical protein
MTTKMKQLSRAAAPLRPVALTPPWTMEERLHRIEVLGQRINGYVQYMSQDGNLNATSVETKERAIVAFYEQLVVTERQLAHIHDSFQLE